MDEDGESVTSLQAAPSKLGRVLGHDSIAGAASNTHSRHPIRPFAPTNGLRRYWKIVHAPESTLLYQNQLLKESKA